MIIADIGGTHGNSLEYFRHAIDFAVPRRDNLWLKVQLFGEMNPAAVSNPVLDKGLFKTITDMAFDSGVVLFPSVFDYDSYDLADRSMPIKFAYSMRNSPMVAEALEDYKFLEVFVSRDWMSIGDLCGGISLLMPAPGQYPVLTELAIDKSWFESFDGISDHTLGTLQSEIAIDCGARWVEKHVKFNGFHNCPDAKFAITEEELSSLCEYDSKNSANRPS